MSPIETLMRSWLDDPDPVKREHARNRMAIGFDDESNLPPPDPAPPARFNPAVYHIVRECPHRDSACGCAAPTCRAGKGDWDGGRQTSFENCLRCLGLSLTTKET